MENKENKKILEDVKLKISISNFEEEEKIDMKKTSKNIMKSLTTVACAILLTTGVVFAGSKVIEKIWKIPEKIEVQKDNICKITEESKRENIPEEKAKEIAINKLNEIGFKENIIKTDHYKLIDSNKIMYRFITEDYFSISIDGISGNFFEIWNVNKNIQDENITISEDEAKEIANKYYKLFGFKEGEYEITKVWSNNKEGSGKGEGYRIDIEYNKKYGETYNPYQYVSLSIESKNKTLGYFRTENIPYDNNETKVTQEEAVQIALNEDKKIETNKIEKTEVKKSIVKMNADAYDRINNKEEYYKAKQTVDYPIEERNYYVVNERIRNAWVVEITYEDNYNGDIVRRYTESIYNYFIDCTTGEIIGGAPMHYSDK